MSVVVQVQVYLFQKKMLSQSPSSPSSPVFRQCTDLVWHADLAARRNVARLAPGQLCPRYRATLCDYAVTLSCTSISQSVSWWHGHAGRPERLVGLVVRTLRHTATVSANSTSILRPAPFILHLVFVSHLLPTHPIHIYQVITAAIGSAWTISLTSTFPLHPLPAPSHYHHNDRPVRKLVPSTCYLGVTQGPEG